MAGPVLFIITDFYRTSISYSFINLQKGWTDKALYVSNLKKFVDKERIINYTVKLGYNEQLGTGHFCSL